MLQRILQEETEATLKQEVQKDEETHHLSQSILTMLAIVAINAVALNFVKKAKSKFPRIFRYVQESTITTFIGVLAGLCLHQFHQTHILAMIRDGYQNFFMIILLPPIIFESTINMHKKSFFRNIGSILMFAVVGTLVAACLTALGIYLIGRTGYFPDFKFTFGESLAFGSLISSTDPVSVLAVFKEMSADLTLQSLIFGESILNDAISIVLYNTVTAYSQEGYSGLLSPVLKFALMLMGSICIGFVIGIICAMVLKTYFGNSDKNNSATTEITLMVVIPWAAYLIGEGFNLSGVVTILFCGIAMTKYALPYLSPAGKQLTQSLYGALSTTSENLAFIFIGVGFFSFEHHWERLTATLLLTSCIVITAARFIQISIISKITNLFRNKNKITQGHKMIMIYSGFRGAMAFALATNAVKAFPQNGAGSMMLTLTLFYASLTIFVQGSLLAPVMDYYHVKGRENDSLILDDDDAIENNPWDKVKFSFHRLENLLVRLILRWRDEDGRPRHEIYTDEESMVSSVKVHPSPGVLVKVRENDFTPVRRICSDGEAPSFILKPEIETHTKKS